MSAFLANLAIAVAILVIAVSLLLAVVAGLAYARLRHGRMLWITVAFAVFTLQGVLLTVQAVQERGDAEFPAGGLLSLLILLALYFAVLKR